MSAPSPYRSAAPNRAAAASSGARDRQLDPKRDPTSASSARMPPSPLLSARMTTVAYLSATISSMVQTSSEKPPSRVARSLPPVSVITVCSV